MRHESTGQPTFAELAHGSRGLARLLRDDSERAAELSESIDSAREQTLASNTDPRSGNAVMTGVLLVALGEVRLDVLCAADHVQRKSRRDMMLQDM
jgi:hypothetical protein